MIANVFFTVFAVGNIALAFYAKRNDLGFVWRTWKRFRPMMLVEVTEVLVVTFTLIMVLMKLLSSSNPSHLDSCT